MTTFIVADPSGNLILFAGSGAAATEGAWALGLVLGAGAAPSNDARPAG